MNPLHHAFPNSQSRVAGNPSDYLGPVVAKPDAGGVIRRHPHKPAVKIVVGGAGFARRLNAGYFGPGAGALGARHHVGQKIQHIIGRFLRHGLHRIRRIVQQYVALGVIDLGIDPRLVVIPIISKSRIGRGDVHHRNAVRQAAQSQRAQSHVGNLTGISLFIGNRPPGFQGKPHILRCKFKGLFRRHGHHQIYRNGVGGNLNGLFHRHAPLPYAAVGGVFGPPSGVDGKIFGHVVQHRGWGDITIFQRRSIDAHRLDGRTRRPGSAGGPVEHQVARFSAPAAVHCFDLACVLIDNNHGALRHFSIVPQHAGKILCVQKHLVHLSLNLRVQRADNAQAAGIDHLPSHLSAVALFLHQVFHHTVKDFVSKIRPDLLFVVPLVVLAQLKLFRFGRPGFAFCDKAILRHLVQHDVPPIPVEFRKTDGVVFIGIFGNSRDGGALHQRQLIQLFAKIDFSRRAHAVGALAQVNGV